VLKGSKEELAARKATTGAAVPGSNLDAVLDELTGPKQITTLDKSRIDWSQSKAEEGDAHELEQFAKSG